MFAAGTGQKWMFSVACKEHWYLVQVPKSMTGWRDLLRTVPRSYWDFADSLGKYSERGEQELPYQLGLLVDMMAELAWVEPDHFSGLQVVFSLFAVRGLCEAVEAGPC